MIDFDGHFEHDKTDRVVAAATSSAIIGRAQRAGEAKVQRRADEPTEAAVDLTLRGQRNGMRGELIVREPPARCLGKRDGEGVAIALVEGLGMGNKGIEIKGRELIGGKR